jgi:hypothetical protein
MLHLDKSHNERDTVKQFIQSNKQLKNSLLIFDRGYHSPPLALAGGAEELIKQLVEEKIYFRRSLALTICPHRGQSERWGLARNENSKVFKNNSRRHRKQRNI